MKFLKAMITFLSIIKYFILGVLPLSSAYVVLLFDSGASHSFVSARFVRQYHLGVEDENEKGHVRL